MSKTAELQALYARIPRLECKRLCQESCGPILCSREERRIIVKAVGRGPVPDKTLTCSLLVDGACSAYAVRPLICRLWGVVRAMACPHGCVPERWLTDADARTLLMKAQRIGGEDRAGMKEIAQRIKNAVLVGGVHDE